MGPTVDWHLSPNKSHIVCAKKKLLLASPEECLLASKLCHCPSEEKVNQLSMGVNRGQEKTRVVCYSRAGRGFLWLLVPGDKQEPEAPSSSAFSPQRPGLSELCPCGATCKAFS